MSKTVTSRARPAQTTLIGVLALALTTTALAQPRRGLFNPTGEMPVPEVVQMPRPAEDELTRARELYDQFVGGLAAEDRALLERYPRMLEVRPPGSTCSTCPSPSISAGISSPSSR